MALLKRRQFFEVNDQPWFRGLFREAFLDCLNFALRVYRAYDRMHFVLAHWAQVIQADAVLDLASGGAGPIATVIRQAQRDHFPLPQIVLSDLYPSTRRYAKLQARYGTQAIAYCPESVSAFDLSRSPYRSFTIAAGFHHFSPAQAQHVVTQALSHGHGLLILEPFKRNRFHLLMQILGGPWIYLLAPFFQCPFSWKKLLICTLIPIVPLLLYFDSIVSVLRCYRPEEIDQMIPLSLRHQVLRCYGELPMLLGVRATFYWVVRPRATATAQPQPSNTWHKLQDQVTHISSIEAPPSSS